MEHHRHSWSNFVEASELTFKLTLLSILLVWSEVCKAAFRVEKNRHPPMNSTTDFFIFSKVLIFRRHRFLFDSSLCSFPRKFCWFTDKREIHSRFPSVDEFPRHLIASVCPRLSIQEMWLLIQVPHFLQCTARRCGQLNADTIPFHSFSIGFYVNAQ
jgi:hypothetical protein